MHAHPVQVALAVAGQEERGLTQGLRRQAARVHRAAPGLRPWIDDRDPFAEVRGLGSSLLAGRPGAEDHEVEPVGRPVHPATSIERIDAPTPVDQRGPRLVGP